MTTADAFSSPRTGPSVPRQRQAPFAAPGSSLRVCVERPGPHTAVVHVRGEVDSASAPKLTEVLVARLRGTLRTLVVDLSEVDFLGAAGLSTLLYADLLARQVGIELCVVTGGNRWAVRALTVTGIDQRLAVREHAG
ncbi:anti-anti-sigma factor [Amycolatopsis bartoniae]|uniref:STAS domain-containing protein n=1 Tax=Amycolatopsis bartoniae TaxID=941986 RepID=A0A8H9MB98_9PSEU|nr:STAS domain-containing protein [Amycolatopsis bartoniae]MBB2938269.1 anti-anti-sigma factor [Amycolatopsis bartoniae]GHF33921.1 hypothetical protein GCM10017566_03230 [Amycolatopsis bartoniae]